MNWNRWIRQIHRWMSVAFTMLVIANIVVMVRGGQREPDVLTYSPLLPLALLLLSGWYLLVLPYLAKRRRGNGGAIR